MNELKERHNAVHEAAHCVVGYYHGHTLTPDKGIQIGDFPVCWMRSPAHDARSFRAVEQSLAGWAAEMILSPNLAKCKSDDDIEYAIHQARNGSEWPDEEAPDENSVCEILLSWMPNASDAELLQAYREQEAEVLAVLREPAIWAAVLRLADVLLVERHIGDPTRVETLIGDVRAPHARPCGTSRQIGSN